MDVINDFFVRRYRVYNPLKQPVFGYSDGILISNHSNYSNEKISGWLVDWEKVISGPKRVIFYEFEGCKCVDVDGARFKIDGDLMLKHKRGLLFSRFSIVKGGVAMCEMLYFTPWWRLMFDDGSHSDLHFPLKYFSKIWNEKLFIF